MIHLRPSVLTLPRLPVAAARASGAGVAVLVLALGLAGCGGGDTRVGESTAETPTPTTSPSASATGKGADTRVLSGNTAAGSVDVFARRPLCVNASDYYYVLTNFSVAPTATAEPDAAFVEAAIARAENLAGTLARQVPAAQVDNAKGAYASWRVVAREGRQRGYRSDDLPGFFDDLADQIKQYVPGNAALTQYLADACSAKVAEFGTALAPPA